MSDYRATWVPERPGMDWDDAAAVAVAWVDRESAEQRRPALLVTVAKNSLDGCLQAFAGRHDWTTPRSSQRTRGLLRGRPVLAYVPDEKTLQVAASFARGSSLCVIEGGGTPMAGWARSAGAVDLLGGAAPEPLPAALLEGLKALDFYGNNGWTRGFGQDQARRRLEDLHTAGLLDRDAITGDMLARGYHDRAVKRLGQLIDAVSGARGSAR